MSNTPTVVHLPIELQSIQAQWLAPGKSRLEQDALYANEFAGPFAKLFAKLPLHGAPPALARPKGLVSVLGFSWQPLALMAAWARPERMLVIGTEASLAMHVGEEGVLSVIARVSGVPRDAIEPVCVGDPGEEDLYRAVRDFLQKVPGGEVFVDPTGGKKSMSAAAALAGFIRGARLVYVDYAEYHGPNRIPIAGTEYPRLLANPLFILGELELDAILSAFNRSDFREAERRSAELAHRLYEPREAECLTSLSQGYALWDAFDFQGASDALQRASSCLERFAGQGRWGWERELLPVLQRNLVGLNGLSRVEKEPTNIANGVPLLVWYLAAAKRALQAEKLSLTALLTYALVERYVVLCLWVDFGLDANNPDYARVEKEFDQRRYDTCGRRLMGEKYESRAPQGQIMLMGGVQLLATLMPERLPANLFGPINQIAKVRNTCEYEHGFLPEATSSRGMAERLDMVARLLASVVEPPATLDELLPDFAFPVLSRRG